MSYLKLKTRQKSILHVKSWRMCSSLQCLFLTQVHRTELLGALAEPQFDPAVHGVHCLMGHVTLCVDIHKCTQLPSQNTLLLRQTPVADRAPTLIHSTWMCGTYSSLGGCLI